MNKLILIMVCVISVFGSDLNYFYNNGKKILIENKIAKAISLKKERSKEINNIIKKDNIGIVVFLKFKKDINKNKYLKNKKYLKINETIYKVYFKDKEKSIKFANDLYEKQIVEFAQPNLKGVIKWR